MSQYTLLWFTNSLRLGDNLIFNAVSEDIKLHCTYIHDPRTELFFHLGEKNLSTHRAKFLEQTISTLDQQLSTLGQCLHRIDGDYLESLTQQVQQYSIDKIVTSRHVGIYEQQAIKAIIKRFPYLQIVIVETATIFQESQLPFVLSDLDKSFTPFRKRVSVFINIPHKWTSKRPGLHVSLESAAVKLISDEIIASAIGCQFYRFHIKTNVPFIRITGTL
ncbi:deoxyribodipyrimidine photo-lyase [bacterium]|nr:deoxyribodipyrimidine photo-lyase [bacterium]